VDLPRWSRRPIAAWPRPLIAGSLHPRSIGSCALPKPQIPSIGAVPNAPAAPGVGLAIGASRPGVTAALVAPPLVAPPLVAPPPGAP
jgi:hypothetical protein